MSSEKDDYNSHACGVLPIAEINSMVSDSVDSQTSKSTTLSPVSNQESAVATHSQSSSIEGPMDNLMRLFSAVKHNYPQSHGNSLEVNGSRPDRSSMHFPPLLKKHSRTDSSSKTWSQWSVRKWAYQREDNATKRHHIEENEEEEEGLFGWKKDRAKKLCRIV
ncbi:hypothetical protein Ciccas_003985 [Cichlidogyrus casuarinus]|uniref:Uncharacterized protein n=1 Tax=Cichlidogyrus casuarinus TaxID=1844966 RepID=A0ABD2QCW8_9PLAT